MKHPVRLRIEQPRKELGKVRAHIQAMRRAKSIEILEESWTEYLQCLERVWNKACNLYGSNPGWNGWVGKFKTLRDKDPLLAYLQNARGANQHTVQEIVDREPGEIGINPAGGKDLYIDELRISQGKITIKSPQIIKLTFIPAKIKLLPVLNRGIVFPVPTIHLENPINPNNVIEIAEIGAGFYDNFLNAAQAFFSRIR